MVEIDDTVAVVVAIESSDREFVLEEDDPLVDDDDATADDVDVEAIVFFYVYFNYFSLFQEVKITIFIIYNFTIHSSCIPVVVQTGRENILFCLLPALRLSLFTK